MMLMQSCRSESRRRGTVAVIVAVMLTGIMAVVALAVDGGMLMSESRHAQATADAAAMAAACILYKNYPSYIQDGSFPVSAAQQAAYNVAKANGVDPNSSNVHVTVNIPPTSGPYTDASKYPGCVEVILDYQQPRYFSGIFSSFNPAATGGLTLKARAVARGAWTAYKAGIIVLAYSGKATLDNMGNGYFTDVGAPVIVNSNDPAAAYDNGNGYIKAPEYDITGGDAGKTTHLENTSGMYDPSIIYTGVHPTPDPLAYLPAPGQPGAPSIPSAGSITTVNKSGGGKTYTLTPGSYGGNGGPSLPNFTNKDTVIFQQSSAGNDGIYYLVSGGLTANSANLQMDSQSTGGIMIYNAGTGQSDGINLQGNSSSTINLSPLTDGPYKNMMFWQDRNASEDFQVAGNGAFNISGTFYIPGATVKVTGNGGTSLIGSQYVSKELTISGNGNVQIQYDPNKVTPTRILTLVE